MPTFRAIPRIVNLASLLMISFIFETISLGDANFGLPDFGAFLMESTPDLNLFFQRLTVSSDTKEGHEVVECSVISCFKEQPSFG